ncbi:hypothetical protein GCM10023322_46550 [Rugosimonospora acidiphila]|uniref:Secreted protein n=1 Tax=Rugosimonospora acidiphila TaxID=556531 RepID=A0ABP9S301_9ACTN
MSKRRILRGALTVLIAAAGVLSATAGTANADNGADGFPILHAVKGDQVHKCNVVGPANNYEAVVCIDLVTSISGGVYHVSAREEAMCESYTNQLVACDKINDSTTLETGAGATSTYGTSCNGDCPAGRLYDSTRTWDYTVAGAAYGSCSNRVNTSYQVWGVGWGDTEIVSPTGVVFHVSDGYANDGANMSTGHYFICP